MQSRSEDIAHRGALNFKVVLEGVTAGSDVAIWMPLPLDTPSQRVVNGSFTPPPGFEFERGVSRGQPYLFVEGIATKSEIVLSNRVEIEFLKSSHSAASQADRSECRGWIVLAPGSRQTLIDPKVYTHTHDRPARFLEWTCGPRFILVPPADGTPAVDPPSQVYIEIDGEPVTDFEMSTTWVPLR